MARGRAWGNALGGWRLQGRGPGGKFLRKGAASRSSTYKPSRNQLAAQARAKAEKKAVRRKKAKKAAKTVAIVGGVAAAGAGAYYGLNAASSAPAGAYTAHMTKKFVRNAAAYSQRSAATNVPKATVIKAGNFPQVRMSPRAQLSPQGFSSATGPMYHAAKLLPPVGFHTNTRRPSRYAHTGDALKSVQPGDMTGKELIPRADAIKAARSFNARKTNWKRAGKAKAAKAAAAAMQNPSPKAVKTKAPSRQMTIDDIMPAKPATGTGSKASPAKAAATGGGRKAVDTSPLAALAAQNDSAETKTMGKVVEGVYVDEDGNTEKVKVVNVAKLSEAERAALRKKSIMNEKPVDPARVRTVQIGSDGSREQVFNQKYIRSLVNSGMTKSEFKAQLKASGVARADEAALEFDRIRANTKAANRRKNVNKRAEDLAGEVVTKKMGESQRMAKIQDKMASGKMEPQMDRIQSAYGILQDIGMSKFGSATLRKNSRDDVYTSAERKAMRDYALWLDQKAAMKKG